MYRFSCEYMLDDCVEDKANGFVFAKTYEQAVAKIEKRLQNIYNLVIDRVAYDSDFIWCEDEDELNRISDWIKECAN